MNYQSLVCGSGKSYLKSSSFSQALSRFVSLKTISVAVVLNTSDLAQSLFFRKTDYLPSKYHILIFIVHVVQCWVKITQGNCEI